jgi:hypothetical protein
MNRQNKSLFRTPDVHEEPRKMEDRSKQSLSAQPPGQPDLAGICFGEGTPFRGDLLTVGTINGGKARKRCAR